MTPESLTLFSFALVVLMKIVCFILGYLTIRLGHDLIASGAKGEFKFSAKMSGATTNLASVSPGLLFVLLGTMLIGFAMFVEKGATLTKTDPQATDNVRVSDEVPAYPAEPKK